MLAGCILAPWVLAGCNAIVGLRDIEEGASSSTLADGGDARADGAAPGQEASSSTPPTGPGDAGDAGDAGATDADAGTDPVDAGPTILEGTLHFLQTPGSVSLGSGSDTVTLTANGSFELPVHGSSYAIAVTAQPPGQTCWVTNGNGSTASPSAGLEVRCSVVKKSVGTATGDKTLTTSSDYVPMDDVADVVFQNDVAARTLLYLSVPAVYANTQPNVASQHRVAIFVDGQLHAEAVTRVHFAAQFNDTPVLVLSTPTLPAGTHTVRAQWRRVDGSDTVTRAAFSPAGAPIRPELGAVVLDSLSSFDRAPSASSTTATTVPAFDSDFAIGVPQLSFTAPVAQPGLLVASVPDLQGQHLAKLQVDGTTAAYHRVADNDYDMSPTTAPTPMALRSVSAGAHTLDVLVNGISGAANVRATYGGAAGSNAVKPASLTALLWKAGTAFASWESTTDFEVVPPYPAERFKQGGQAVSVTTTKPSKALVMMDVTRVASIDPGETPSEVSLFVGGVQGPTVVVGRGGWGDEHRSNICSRIGVVDLPAGSTTLDLRFASYTDLRTHVVAARYGVVVLD